MQYYMLTFVFVHNLALSVKHTFYKFCIIIIPNMIMDFLLCVS